VKTQPGIITKVLAHFFEEAGIGMQPGNFILILIGKSLEVTTCDGLA
jgi:hypothetical protein